MTLADGGRFCGDCQKVVRDLSAMTEPEARGVLARAGSEGLCARYVHDREGRIRFATPTTALIPTALLHRAKRVAAAAAVAFPLSAAACSQPNAKLETPTNQTHDELPTEDDALDTTMGGVPEQANQLDAALEPADASAEGGDADAADAHPDADAGASPVIAE